jgi:hypothetical protein
MLTPKGFLLASLLGTVYHVEDMASLIALPIQFKEVKRTDI